MASHGAEISWERGTGETFTDRRYSRAHSWRFDGGALVPASSSPHNVPVPFSRVEHVDPEEAFVAAISSCHMLTFLYVAAKSGYLVDRYHDAAVGETGHVENGREGVTRVTLSPVVEFAGPRLPDDREVARLHHEAHEDCYIANSVRTTIEVRGEWSVARSTQNAAPDRATASRNGRTS